MRAWEAAYLDAPTPGERLAKAGRLIELYREWHPEFFEENEDIEAVADGIRQMHEALGRINLPRSEDPWVGSEGTHRGFPPS